MGKLKDLINNSNLLRIKLLILITLSILLALLNLKTNELGSDIEVGSIWLEDDIISDLTFPILKDEIVYKDEVERAKNKVFPIFDLVKINTNELKDTLQLFFNSFDEFKNSNIASKLNINIIKKQNQAIQKRIYNLLLNEIEKRKNTLIINLLIQDISNDTIIINKNKYEEIVPIKDVKDINILKSEFYDYLVKVYSNQPDLIVAILDVYDFFIRPNLIYNDDLTKYEQEISISKISRNIGIVLEKEKIVSKHERITPEIKQKIISYRIAKNLSSTFTDNLKVFIGNFLIILSILTIYSIYIFIFRKKIFNSNLLLLMISIIILLISLQTNFITQLKISNSYKYLIFIPVASMLITILFDSRMGFYSTVIISLIQGALRGNDYSFVVVSIFTGALSVYTVRNITNRRQIFRSFIFIFIGYFVSITAIYLQKGEIFNLYLSNLIYAFTNSLLSPILTYGLTIFFEKSFNITTDLTYLELSDFTNPGLKELQTDAPGTFMHSLVLSSMVELAAEKIGANPLLAKVGALYHDIGKTLTPHYFIENQITQENIHDELNPYDSVKIIRAHVEEGIKKAETLNLPKSIIDFIPMHHGTMVMKFFYEKAKTMYPDKYIDENDFRYKGPKPNTKETAILMLADACESIVRSLKEKNDEKIKNVVENVFKNRIEDGQLDESPITFSDLKIIKEVFLSCLMGQNHKRIEYPKQDEFLKNTNQS
ncbi:MAG TPA: HDIG domain-containing protein [Ignavibacteriales bacterium]|nr:HDIG domain-containing protein [Ignavibacteriales bacterium]HOL81132.1 HDIG domain-containing protein [Ignavibacteriales bacterium]HOM65235.1 HDIG domain-containing protein [Ignavibacteriales bacterium]HPD66527.1 HDIG domain-containing protein [Ignavibacteriales bacterium]HRR18426.1 HDIG domain-containing protein [Ignavibacteriales bacterium]